MSLLSRIQSAPISEIRGEELVSLFVLAKAEVDVI